jgi:tellurite resistance protein TerC
MAAPVWAWAVFVTLILVLLSLDLGVWHRSPHVVGPREAMRWTAVWVCLALVVAGVLAWWRTPHDALTFLTGYAIEETLSVDNVFVIVLIFSYFQIPPAYQHRVLFWGVLGAVAMRGGFIAAGVLLLARFGWVQYVFGAVLLLAAVRVVRVRDRTLSDGQNMVLRGLQRIVPVHLTSTGPRLIERDPARGNRRTATVLLIALVCVELADLAFATDSIPAVLAVTRDPFIVFTSNVCALLGLRSLYFVLAAAMRHLRALPIALAIIFGFVGLKMLLVSVIEIPAGVVLAVVVAVLGIAAMMNRD